MCWVREREEEGQREREREFPKVFVIAIRNATSGIGIGWDKGISGTKRKGQLAYV